MTQKVHIMAKYLTELCLVDYQIMLELLPSQVAAASLTLALRLLVDNPRRRQWVSQCIC